MKLEEALEKLYSMHQFSIKLGLDRVVDLLEYLGNPQDKLKTFHIAGSNGKGSTASFLASILMEAGYKVALFTSPHFERFNERIRINSIPIPDDYIANFISEMDQYIRDHEPSFFELTTAMAFKYFAENDIDYAVIETGLGGRLDATNVLNPLATLITSISLEHTNILGETLEEIAAEKAGVIKPETKLFIGKMPQEAKNVIIEKAEAKNAQIFLFEEYSTEMFNGVSVEINSNKYNFYSTGLSGYHQFLNSALAVMTIEKTLGISDFDVLNRGVLKVVENSGIQGRYEIYSDMPRVIFDAAHNYEGVCWFKEEFEKEYLKYDNRVLVFGAMRDKEIESMVKELSHCFDEIRIASIDYERALSTTELADIVKPYFKSVVIEKKPASFVDQFIRDAGNECLVLLGSIYLLGNIKEELKKQKMP